MTVCDPHIAKVPQRAAHSSLMTWQEFLVDSGPRIEDDVHELLEHGDMEEDEMFKFLSRLSNTGYQETLGMENLTVFSKTREHFSLACTLKTEPISINALLACNDYVDATLVPSMLYPTCFKAAYNTEQLEGASFTGLWPVGYQLIFFVGQLNETIYDYAWAVGDDVRQDRKGIMFALHERNSRRVMADRPLLAPGFLHQIDMKTSVRKRIKREKADGSTSCVNDDDIYFYDTFHGTSVSYEKVRFHLSLSH